MSEGKVIDETTGALVDAELLNAEEQLARPTSVTRCTMKRRIVSSCWVHRFRYPQAGGGGLRSRSYCCCN
jgi:hypothetical protein